jgi:hypothetical protein
MIAMAIAQHNAPTPSRPDQGGCSLVTILVPVVILAAAVGLGRIGWNHWGALGAAVGIILAIPLGFLSIVLLGLALMGFAFVFDRAEFDRQVGKTPSEPSEPSPVIPAVSPSRRRGAFRIRTFMIVVVVLAIWLGIGLAMVRASANDRAKENAILIVILVPLGCVANHYALKWTDRWIGNPKPADRPKP